MANPSFTVQRTPHEGVDIVERRRDMLLQQLDGISVDGSPWKTLEIFSGWSRPSGLGSSIIDLYALNSTMSLRNY